MNAAESAPPLPAVHTMGLSRSYGPMIALNSLDLTVNRLAICLASSAPTAAGN